MFWRTFYRPARFKSKRPTSFSNLLESHGLLLKSRGLLLKSLGLFGPRDFSLKKARELRINVLDFSLFLSNLFQSNHNTYQFEHKHQDSHQGHIPFPKRLSQIKQPVPQCHKQEVLRNHHCKNPFHLKPI